MAAVNPFLSDIPLPSSIAEEIRCVRENVGLWTRRDFSILLFRGRDALNWLHRQTTQDILSLATGAGAPAAFLDRQGRVLASVLVLRWEDEAWLLVSDAVVPSVLARVEQGVFLEDVQVEPAPPPAYFIALEGPRARIALGRFLNTPPDVLTRRVPRQTFRLTPWKTDQYEMLILQHTTSGEEGFLIVPENGRETAVYDDLRSVVGRLQGKEISSQAQEVLRIEAGVPRWGVDIDSSSICNETPLITSAVSFTKGCYPGQEVVARLRTYGAPKQLLLGLVLNEAPTVNLPTPPFALCLEGKKAALVRSLTYSPTLGRHIAIASVSREARASTGSVSFLTEYGQAVIAEIVDLPFVRPTDPTVPAKNIYDAALERFAETSRAEGWEDLIQMLEEAVYLHPGFEDAYEVLGVWLSQSGALEAAIRYMEALVAINPSSHMGHVNLSRFYGLQGRIEEAEREKAIAAQIERQRSVDAQSLQASTQSERQRIIAEAQRKIELFQEVLALDPDDPVALFGLAQCYVQLDRFEAAVPPLRHALEVKPDYSAAYLLLGRCLERLGRDDEALALYEEAIPRARLKGDLMPMREMEQRALTLAERVGKRTKDAPPTLASPHS